MPAAPAAPAQASPSAPVSAPKPAPEPAQSEFMASVEADLEALDDAKPISKSAPKQAKPAAKPEKAEPEPEPEVKPPEDAEKPAETEKDKAKSSTFPEDQKDPVRISELRKAYNELKSSTKELRKQQQAAQAELEELRSKPAPDTKPILDKLSAAEKRQQELENEIRFVNYSKSAEFQEKYAKPYADAWNRAVSDFKQLAVRVPAGVDPDTEQPKFTQRQATPEDLLALANMPLSEMDAKAEDMFGRSAPRVIRHVEKVRELALAQQEALAKAQKEAGDREQVTSAQTQEQQKERIALWKKTNDELAEKYPKWFKPADGDAEGNAILEKGFALADRLFLPTKETAPKTTEEAVRLHALIRHKVANHDRLALKLKTANARITELESALAEYEKSEPRSDKAGQTKPVKGKSYREEADAEIEALDKQMI